jgi:CheY-like chemotaxis protein
MKPDPMLPPVMIVDDDDDDALLLEHHLRTAGVQNPTLHFRDGGDAFLFLKQFCPPQTADGRLPTVMFLDVNMHGLSGFDVLVWARHQQPLAGMKIIMLSGANEIWDEQIAAKLGADEYLEKFPDADVLKRLVPASAADAAARSVAH